MFLAIHQFSTRKTVDQPQHLMKEKPTAKNRRVLRAPLKILTTNIIARTVKHSKSKASGSTERWLVSVVSCVPLVLKSVRVLCMSLSLLGWLSLFCRLLCAFRSFSDAGVVLQVCLGLKLPDSVDALLFLLLQTVHLSSGLLGMVCSWLCPNLLMCRWLVADLSCKQAVAVPAPQNTNTHCTHCRS